MNNHYQNKRVLIVEDEPKIAQVLVDFLTLEGFVTTVLHDGLDAVARIQNDAIDFVILDLMLPHKDGLTICKEVRSFSNVPILMLTARVEEIDRLIGLEIGADDYVCKPFSAREVVARVKAIIRRMEPSAQLAEDEIAYKHLVINLERFKCHAASVEVDLTPVEFRLLHTMLKRPGVVHSRDSLMQVCYVDDRVVSSRTIDSHIKNLRSKLLLNNKQADLLHSIYGVGYKIE
ncbi:MULTISPECIES: response regulator [unclassified Shewanella]|uniref:response regulator n=1 Tax=unclassified Shewanella TaxID=196818 RepID=UPI000C860C3F|nr:MULTISPECIES: response regulator [unclassified Shewanella]MDO6620683.1 response regulator [Shewanella sp. 6_MG-2023]MDO6677961.1 response regulator [Shewanella sp. 4_MG-2023]MDO6777022.1 response regulator [Shewanella sp. 3_MG-2023]PMG28782.1 two-component system response regulator BaeR [Shewanella sp. 10N.286.52.C2]PMH88090.1 two-component system response regulator BaeR [Shewanella sp. 10N.286.48.B5]